MERKMDKLEEMLYFSTPVYVVKKPEFLEVVRSVSGRYEKASKARKKTANYVNLMTASFSHEPELKDFSQYISQTAWNILSSQGFKMDQLVTYFTEMWTQEHNRLSSMNLHVHGNNSQISVFYFFEVPEKACKLVIHDPRPGKVIINLPEKKSSDITMGSHQVVFTPQVGALIFINAWVPHSLSKNLSNKSMKFVHMNLSVAINPDAPKKAEKTVEVI
ncbi:MAG: hypothetical protein EBT78_18380 [Betaproteobacteria bacterium]|nr:hypothetical protein [Betaproteobacteria bacterium]NBT69719.1 hypothetical protein [Betaproteobacteria bacterium]